MKKIALMTVILTGLTGPVLAETQTYSRIGEPTNYVYHNAQIQQQAQAVQQQAQVHEVPNIYMVYPGREEYGQHYGHIPRHPGDYKDAVDRGSWAGGGDAAPRSFDIR